jgi:sporulation protein YlmC with PRC-barrel domain
MIRHLLATTALATFALAASGAFAADSTAMQTQPRPVFSAETKDGLVADEKGYFTATDKDILASNLLGARVYNGAGEDAEQLGDVNDVIIADNGAAEAVVIGVGGFLGIGEKDVAIDFDRIAWVQRDGDRWLTVEASKQELEAAPAYEPMTIEPSDDLALATDGDKRPMEAGKTEQVASASDDASVQERMKAGDETKVATQTDAMTATGNDTSMDSVADMRATLAPADRNTISADQLIGATVYDANNDNIGEIGDVLLADDRIVTFVVDVGGFLGIGEKPVAVDIDSIEIMTDESGSLWVFTPFTEEQLDQHAAYSEADYKNDPDRVILR